MELLSLPAPPLTILSFSSSSRKIAIDSHSIFSAQAITVSGTNRCPDARKLKFTGFRAQASVSVRATSKSNQVTEEATKRESQLKDDDLVFVAGATGRVGSRTVRELLKLGFRVRAGVRSARKAETLLQGVQQMKLDDGTTVVEKLEIVECDLERDRIAQAINNASVVICCIGASEKEVFDITGPYRIDYQATKNLIDAATVAGVNHFILLTSLGTNKIRFPAAILNLFWGVLIWKRKAEEALIESGLPYTIVRPGGMERPTDAFKETHNIVLSKEDTLFGGQVSNLQVAELMAFMARNRDLSYCKVVEVIAETTAPLTPVGELLTRIPSQRLDSSLPKEPQAMGELDTVPSKKVNFEAKSSVIKEPAEPQLAAPLSPYVVYDDLKPPTSPTPTPSGSTQGDPNVVQAVSKASTEINKSGPITAVPEKKSVLVEVQGGRPLSPYAVYEDLKPPTSPTPSCPKVGGSSVGALSSTNSGSTVMEKTPNMKVETEIGHLSPYSVASPKAVNSTAQPLTSDKLDNKQPSGELKPRPLSPFTMYDDLKPPSSPMPSPRKY